MQIASGGKNVYGFSIGILMLESRFPRIPGDMGNATTWDFPVLYRIVKNASPDRVVRQGDRSLLNAFIEAARALEAEGVRALTTNCGFLAMFHQEMTAAVEIPVFTSSLMQVPLVSAMLKPEQQVGIITIDAQSLSPSHLAAVGVDRVPHVIVGTEHEKVFTHAILDNQMTLDSGKSEAELIRVAQQLVNNNPTVGAIVLECTNMTPYARAIQAAVNLPVFDIFTLVNFVYLAVTRPAITGYM